MAERQRRIAVIDDSPEVLGLFTDALRVDGGELCLFYGSATLQDIESCRPDLLVLDLRLARGGLSGMEIIRLVRSHRQLRLVPIIVCTAAVDGHAREVSLVPRLFVLAKPFSLEALESCVDTALAEGLADGQSAQLTARQSIEMAGVKSAI